jgi:hypothetical protein
LAGWCQPGNGEMGSSPVFSTSGFRKADYRWQIAKANPKSKIRNPKSYKVL